MIDRLRFVSCLTVALLSAASGCSNVMGVSPPTVALSTDASSYVAKLVTPGPPATYRFTVVARFRNSGAAAVQLARCYPNSSHPIFGVPMTDSKKSSGYDPAWACVGHDHPIVVAAGETRTDTLVITGPTAWDGQTQKPLGEMEGTFRLQYGSDACNGSGGCMSQPFTVRLGQ